MAADESASLPVDPSNLRPMLFLDVASHMMLARDWEYRAVTVTMESHTRKGRFALYGANHPSTIDAVDERRIDISILNPAAMLTMAYRGVGAFDRVRRVATIAVLPHDDRLGFAVADRLGFTRLEDIAKARYPLRVSTRGSTDACTPVMVDVVLRAHGFSLADIVSWGGQVFYDQPMPNHPSRIGRLERGEIDAVFDEGIALWADLVTPAGRAAHRPGLAAPQRIGARRFSSGGDRTSALSHSDRRRAHRRLQRVADLLPDRHPADLIEAFCEALVSRRESICWTMGGVEQPPLPLEQMVRETPATPLDVPLHHRAAEVWRRRGYLS